MEIKLMYIFNLYRYIFLGILAYIKNIDCLFYNYLFYFKVSLN